jgi:hypothetical protein
MKKILFFMMLLALVIPFAAFSEDIEAVAGEANYKIDMKLHNIAQNAYNAKYEMELCLPVAEKFKLYIIASAEDNATFNATTEGTNQNWTAINNDLALFVGIPITDIFDLNFLVEGGTAISSYSIVNYTTASEKSSAGSGFLKFGVGIKVKSAAFGNKLDDLKIRQFVKIYLNGTGAGAPWNAMGVPAADITNTGGVTSAYTKSQNFELDYDGFVGTGIPFDIGLPKFDIGLELAYGIVYGTVTAAGTNVVADFFDVKPSLIKGYGNFKVNFGINPAANIETNVWLKPGFEIGQYTWDRFGTGAAFAAQTLSLPTFLLGWGADFKVTFAKIVYVKLANEWKYTLGFNGYYIEPANGRLESVSGGSTFATINADPSMRLGFNFDGWTLEMNWRPRITVYTSWDATKKIWTTTNLAGGNGNSDIVTSGADTNILNLSNWDFSVSCSFPPPAK